MDIPISGQRQSDFNWCYWLCIFSKYLCHNWIIKIGSLMIADAIPLLIEERGMIRSEKCTLHPAQEDAVFGFSI